MSGREVVEQWLFEYSCRHGLTRAIAGRMISGSCMMLPKSVCPFKDIYHWFDKPALLLLAMYIQ